MHLIETFIQSNFLHSFLSLHVFHGNQTRILGILYQISYRKNSLGLNYKQWQAVEGLKLV